MPNQKKGVVMVVVIGLILMLLILGAAAVMISTGHFGTSFHQIKRTRALYAAEAAMQHALWKCRKSAYNLSTGDSETITITDPKYTLSAKITIAPPNTAGLNPISIKVTY